MQRERRILRSVGTLTACAGAVVIVLLSALASPTAKADPPFSANVRLGPDIGSASSANPYFVAAPDGTLFAAWQDTRNGDYDIWFSRSSDGGLTWTDPGVRVDHDTTGAWQGGPVLARSATGVLYAAWQDDRNGDRDIYFSRSTDGGLTWSSPDTRVNRDATAKTQHQQAIAVHGDSVYLAWSDERSGEVEIYFSASTDGGVTWTDPDVRIGDPAVPPMNSNLPFLEVDDSGTIYASWADNRTGDMDIRFARSLDGGATWTDGSRRVNTDAGSALQARVALAKGPGSALYAVWQDDRSGDYDIYFAASTDGGDTWTDPNVRVSSDPTGAAQESPEILVDAATGHLYTVWTDQRNGDRDVYLARSTDGGETWTSYESRVNDDSTATIQWIPRLVLDQVSRRLYISWTDWRSGHAESMLAHLQLNRFPVIAETPAPPSSATVGVPLTFTFTATDPDGDALAWSKASGPAWLDVGSANGTAYGVPTQGDVGTNTFTVDVADGQGGSDVITFSIAVESPPAPAGTSAWLWAAVLVGIAVIAAALALFALRRRRRGASP